MQAPWAYDGRAVDVWSVGICSFVIVSGRFPFHVSCSTNRCVAKGRQAIAEAAGRAHELAPAQRMLETIAQRSEHFSADHLVMLDGCLAIDPQERPRAHQLEDHTWLKLENMVQALSPDDDHVSRRRPGYAHIVIDTTIGGGARGVESEDSALASCVVLQRR